MNNNATAQSWQAALSETYAQILQQFIAIAPQLLVAMVLLLAGWVLAWLAARGARGLLRVTNSLLGRWLPATTSGRRDSLAPAQIKFGGRVVFWSIMFFFIAAAASAVGLAVFSNLVAGIIAYLPKLLAGLLIILAGYWLSNALKTLASGAAVSAGLSEGKLLGATVQVAVIFTALVIGIEQLGIDIQFLTELLAVVIGVVLAGFSLAFGLGARQLVANVIGAQQVYRHCRIGETVTLGETSGVIIEITPTIVVVDTGAGRATIPARLFQEYIVSITDGPSGEGACK